MGVYFDGANAEEVQDGIDAATADGDTEAVTYLTAVQADRLLKKADVTAFEIILANPGNYPASVVLAQAEWATGRYGAPEEE